MEGRARVVICGGEACRIWMSRGEICELQEQMTI